MQDAATATPQDSIDWARLTAPPALPELSDVSLSLRGVLSDLPKAIEDAFATHGQNVQLLRNSSRASAQWVAVCAELMDATAAPDANWSTEKG